MSKISRMTKQVDQWKEKAVKRGDESRYLRKENARIKKERDVYKRKAKLAEKRVKELQAVVKVPTLNAKADIVFIALQLFILARIGFRAISRVLGVLGQVLGIRKVPTPQTIINWVNRLAITRIQQAEHLLECRRRPCGSNGYIWIIDSSIALGAGKIFCVLALRADHYRNGKRAPCLQNVHCIAVAVSASWTGVSVAAFLHKVIEVMGYPDAFLKDRGTDLAKAVRLLGEQGYNTSSIDDVSHVIANLLKHEYGNHPMFETFISACGKVSQKLKQTVLACLSPPKVSTKSRFMNLQRLVMWADKLLKQSPPGRGAKGSKLEKLRQNFDQLPKCKGFIGRFLRDGTALLECQKVLKNEGLQQASALKCESFIEVIPPSSPVCVGFLKWIGDQLVVAERLALSRIGLPTSSDILESVFGVVKEHGVGEVKDACRIGLRLPAICGPLTPEDVQRVLKISVMQEREVTGKISSLISQRRKILSSSGNLEKVLSDDAVQIIELIPGVEKRGKIEIFDEISNISLQTDGPINSPAG